MTIKEMREKDVLRLAERQNQNPTPEAIEEARHTMRLFYRFAAAYYSSFMIDNDRRSSQAAKDAAEAKEEKAHKRAAEALAKYDLRISCPGLYPIIEETNGANFTYGHYYV